MTAEAVFWLIAVLAFVVLEDVTTALVGTGGCLCRRFRHRAGRYGAGNGQAPQTEPAAGD